MQAPEEEIQPLGIVFDSDMGNSIEDVLALALLFGFDTKKPPDANLISLSVTKTNLKAAGFCEAVDRFYGEIANREIPEPFKRVTPPAIGLALDGKMTEDTPVLTATLSRQDAKGKPLYRNEIHEINDTADPAALIRNAFTAQKDQNAAVVLSGPATNLAKVIDLHGAKELIVAKVRVLAIAAGAYPDGPAESGIKNDIPAAKKLFAEWPTPIVAVGPDVGEAILYPAASIESDFGWTESHPIVDAYRAYEPMPYDATTTAMAAALFAVHPDENYFRLSEPGTITVNDDGTTKFTHSATGRHRYLIVDAEKKDLVLKTYTQVVSAQPAPRELPRILKKILEDEKKKEEEKKLRERQKQQQQQ